MSDGAHDVDSALTILRNLYQDTEKEVADTLKSSLREVFFGYERLLREVELKYVEERTKRKQQKLQLDYEHQRVAVLESYRARKLSRSNLKETLPTR